MFVLCLCQQDGVGCRGRWQLSYLTATSDGWPRQPDYNRSRWVARIKHIAAALINNCLTGARARSSQRCHFHPTDYTRRAYKIFIHTIISIYLPLLRLTSILNRHRLRCWATVHRWGVDNAMVNVGPSAFCENGRNVRRSPMRNSASGAVAVLGHWSTSGTCHSNAIFLNDLLVPERCTRVQASWCCIRSPRHVRWLANIYVCTQTRTDIQFSDDISLILWLDFCPLVILWLYYSVKPISHQLFWSRCLQFERII